MGKYVNVNLCDWHQQVKRFVRNKGINFDIGQLLWNDSSTTFVKKLANATQGCSTQIPRIDTNTLWWYIYYVMIQILYDDKIVIASK